MDQNEEKYPKHIILMHLVSPDTRFPMDFDDRIFDNETLSY